MVGRCISIYMGKSNCKYFSGILPVFQLVLFPLSLMLKPKTQKPAITSPPPTTQPHVAHFAICLVRASWRNITHTSSGVKCLAAECNSGFMQM